MQCRCQDYLHRQTRPSGVTLYPELLATLEQSHNLFENDSNEIHLTAFSTAAAAYEMQSCPCCVLCWARWAVATVVV